MPITKKQFEESYRKFPPSKCELFYLKRISAGSLSRNVWPALLTSLGLILPFIIAILSQSFGLPHCLRHLTTYLYMFILGVIGLYSFLIWNKRRKRIKLICDDLNITLEKYEELVNRYYYGNYFPDIKDYILDNIK